MKSLSFLSLALGAVLLAGCVVVPERRVVAVEAVTTPAPVVYQPGYTVTTLSPGYRTVRYNRSVYYVDRDVYYRRQPGGYVVVRRPY